MLKRFEPWFWVLAAVLFSRFIGMTLFPFVDTTEPRYAEIARLMAESGDWIQKKKEQIKLDTRNKSIDLS